MAQIKVKITLIALNQPCTACLIMEGLIWEMLYKINMEYGYVSLESVKLDNLKDIHSIEGLEVESFPAILINGEQITAGSIPMKAHLISIIEGEAENAYEN